MKYFLIKDMSAEDLELVFEMSEKENMKRYRFRDTDTGLYDDYKKVTEIITRKDYFIRKEILFLNEITEKQKEEYLSNLSVENKEQVFKIKLKQKLVGKER